MQEQELRVLIVDDEAAVRHRVVEALNGCSVPIPGNGDAAQCTVEQAASGEEALARVAAHPPDLMLLDLVMDGIGGMDVLKALDLDALDMVVIMVTAHASIDSVVEATKEGAYDFLAKPFTPGTIRALIRKAAAHLLARRHAQDLAREQRRVRFEFIRVLGHELKAPLGVIESYLTMLERHSLGEDLAAYDAVVGRCLVRAQGMRKLIADLLDMTRIEAGERVRHLEEVDVARLARAAIEAAQTEAAPRRITVELDGSTAPQVMLADAGEIEIVLNNLLSNAVKYNRDGGRVTVRLSGDESRVEIAVADTGVGLAPDEIARLFHDFVRIRNARTRNVLGSGLGLSTVKKIARLYGGTVEVESEVRAGSTFTVRLERRHQPAVQVLAPSAGRAT